MKINQDELMEAVENDEQCGFCTECGHRQEGCEPDARNYKCEVCNKDTVFGAEELIYMIAE